MRALHQKKSREEERLFLVQGPKLVGELLACGWPVRAIHASSDVADRFPAELVTVWPRHDLDRMGTLESGNQVIAVAEVRSTPKLHPLDTDELVLALDGVSDPGNLGTLLRIADWYGVRRVLCSPSCVDEYNPKAVQSSMGSLFRVVVIRGDLPQGLDRLRASGAMLYLASMEGQDVLEVELKRPAVLILGSESHGPTQPVRDLAAKVIAIPRAGMAESLNVAMAASALCMEFLRQARVRR